jgi:glycosyltransferase involved in cell wall biosynthesis
MDKKVKLLHLITGLNVGGAEKMVLDLSFNADKSKFDIFVIGIMKEGEMTQDFITKGINPLFLNVTSIRKIFRGIKELRFFLKKEKIDIIHAHMFHSLLFASLAKLIFLKVKIVFTSHNPTLESFIREIIVYILRPLRQVDILFSKIDKKNFFHKKEQTIIPNGIMIQPECIRERSKDKKFTFIAVGRLRPQKNYPQFLKEVIANLVNEMEFKVLIVGGEGDDSETVKELIKDSPLLAEKVEFLGLRRDIPDLLKSADVFVMPSLWEGFPIALIEAGMASLPIIATPVGNIPSIINEDRGYLSTIESFGDTMKLVKDNYEEAIVKGQKLRQHIINNYSIENVVKRHEELYESVLKN